LGAVTLIMYMLIHGSNSQPEAADFN